MKNECRCAFSGVNDVEFAYMVAGSDGVTMVLKFIVVQTGGPTHQTLFQEREQKPPCLKCARLLCNISVLPTFNLLNRDSFDVTAPLREKAYFCFKNQRLRCPDFELLLWVHTNSSNYCCCLARIFEDSSFSVETQEGYMALWLRSDFKDRENVEGNMRTGKGTDFSDL